MTFSVEVESPDDVEAESHSIHIFIDRERLLQFISELDELSKLDCGEHVHFFTKRWGPEDLSTKKHLADSKITNHLKICLV